MNDDFNNACAAFADFHRRVLQGIAQPAANATPPWLVAGAQAWLKALADDPQAWQSRWTRHVADQYRLWQQHVGDAEDLPAKKPLTDSRFRGTAWQQPYFAWLAESYLMTARWTDECLRDAPLDEDTRRRLAFYVHQYVDALSPANFLWSNPEAIARARETQGASLAAGLEQLREDAERGRVSNVDRSAFRVGGNLAVTPGEVVYENRLIQLIQYRASTPQVYERPLVIVPPCINKYYVLDMRPENSFVRHAVDLGHTVFMVSWRSADAELAQLTWDDYLQEGVMTALRTARDIAGTRTVNALGFCVGGTLLASALAVMATRREQVAHSLTLLTTLLDYSDTGELSVFIDEHYVAARESTLAAGGLLDGNELALAFASLRANDLVWRYVVNNYLLGRKPEAFDLLYWNDDSTNLPGPMYVWYLRQMYLENRLRQPGALTMCGTPVDLSRLRMPLFAVAAEQDHIVPWRTAYDSARLLGGRMEFVLTASGHIAGVVNPPPGDRRRYRAGTPDDASAAEWCARTPLRQGSWWPHWGKWLARRAGKRIAARGVGNADHPGIEPAPGRYVTARPTTPEQPNVRSTT